MGLDWEPGGADDGWGEALQGLDDYSRCRILCFAGDCSQASAAVFQVGGGGSRGVQPCPLRYAIGFWRFLQVKEFG